MDYICSFSEVQCTFLLNMTMFMYYFAVILLALIFLFLCLQPINPVLSGSLCHNNIFINKLL